MQPPPTHLAPHQMPRTAFKGKYSFLIEMKDAYIYEKKKKKQWYRSLTPNRKKKKTKSTRPPCMYVAAADGRVHAEPERPRRLLLLFLLCYVQLGFQLSRLRHQPRPVFQRGGRDFLLAPTLATARLRPVFHCLHVSYLPVASARTPSSAGCPPC